MPPILTAQLKSTYDRVNKRASLYLNVHNALFYNYSLFQVHLALCSPTYLTLVVSGLFLILCCNDVWCGFIYEEDVNKELDKRSDVYPTMSLWQQLAALLQCFLTAQQ